MKVTKFRKLIRQALNKRGYDITRFPTLAETRLLNYIAKNEIGVCIDVGANSGQFAERLQNINFKGEILSFEPQSPAFKVLSNKASKFNNWKVFPFALGDFDGTIEMNIAANSVSSSILPMLSIHGEAEPNSKYVSAETVEVKKLDSVAGSIINGNEKIYLKIDAQGFEEKVLKGAEQLMKNVFILQLETSCVELYQGEVLFNEMKQRVENWGFKLSSIENGFANQETGELLQIETIYIRNTERNMLKE